MTTNKGHTRNLVLAAIFLAIAYILPYFTANIPLFGRMLLPMHLPVLICGFVCGAPWAALVGFVAPLLRSVLVGMPGMYPTAIAMMFELAAYGAVCGFMWRRVPKHLTGVYTSLLVAMAAGRVVWGIVRFVLTFMGDSTFNFSLFLAGAFTTAIPGIIAQLILVPAVVLSLQRANGLRTA